MSEIVTRDDVLLAADRLGIAGKPLCIHSSFRSFGPVEGGPGMIIDALLEKGCTVMVPTFSYDFEIPAPHNQRIERNGWDYDSSPVPISVIDRYYSTDSFEISKEDMGAIPSTLVSREGRVRGRHQLNSFSALGPLAHALIDGQTSTDVYAPIRELSCNDGFILLMGVGLTRLTAIHMAENMAGRNLFRRWVNGPDRKPAQVLIGSCSSGFEKLVSKVVDLEKNIFVGKSKWRVFPVKQLLEATAMAIKKTP
jgi:aminoglycoside 3-N-acetyltransferase